MDDLAGGLLLGFVIFVIPALAFAWFTFTDKGRAAWERSVRGDGGPPRHPALRWIAAHPWITCVIAAALGAGAHRLVGGSAYEVALGAVSWAAYAYIALRHLRRTPEQRAALREGRS